MVRGGGETFDLEISRHMAELGVEVSYLTGLPLLGSADEPIDHPRSHTLRSFYSGGMNVYHRFGGWRIRDLDIRLFERKAFSWISNRLQDYDIIQVCELNRLVMRWKQSNQPVPISLRMPGPQIYGPPDALKKADLLVASGASMESFRRDIREDVVDVPNGVDTQRFQPNSANDVRSRFNIPKDAFVFVFVGRMQPVKCVPMIVEAFAKLANPQAHLLLVGHGPEEPEARQAAKQSGCIDRITFAGHLPFGDIPGVFASSDCMLITSWYESFSFVTLEAMATELPVITTDTDWIPRMVQHEQGGLVIPVKDPAALTDAMRRMLEDEAFRKQAGLRNRSYVLEHHSWERSARLLLEAYESLLRR